MRIAALSALVGAILGAGAARADVPAVMTDISPVQSLVAMVMGDLGVPGVIVQHGASPHDYAMRLSEASALEKAEAVFWIGEGLTPWLEHTLNTLAGDAEVIELSARDGVHILPFRKGAVFEAPENGNEEEDGAHGHDHAGLDPHLWLDPDNANMWMDVIAETLVRIDPDNAADYRANAEASKAQIDAAAAEAKTLLTPARGVPFIVFHDAYQYFEHAFGLSAAGAISLSDASAPSPARLAKVRETVRVLGVKCVFPEPQFNPGLVTAVTEGLDLRSAALDPLGAALNPGPGLYPALIRDLAGRMADCLVR